MAKFYVARKALIHGYIKDGLTVRRFDSPILGDFIKKYSKDIKAVVASTSCYFSYDKDTECFDDFIEGIDLDMEKLKVSIFSTDKCNSNPQRINFYFLTDNPNLFNYDVIRADFNSLEEMVNAENKFFNHMKVIWKADGFDIGN